MESGGANLNDEWMQFLQQSHTAATDDNIQYIDSNDNATDPAADACARIHAQTAADTAAMPNEAPNVGALYISTKTKMSYLTEEIPLRAFWDLPLTPYDAMECGIIKKQIKMTTNSPEELTQLQTRLAESHALVEESVIKHVDTIGRQNRSRFLNVRKVSIGINHKNVVCKKKRIRQLVNNSFTLIVRVLGPDDYTFCEIHVKVFNTGKLEMPGVQNDIVFERVVSLVIRMLQTYVSATVDCTQSTATILINSNFFCGYYINRSVLYSMLIKKYNIKTTYDPCTYPGIRCRYYYNLEELTRVSVSAGASMTALATKKKNKSKNIISVTFVIFRTGNVLIMGMCPEFVLYHIYEFLIELFRTEYHAIRLPTPPNLKPPKLKKQAVRTKKIYIDSPDFMENNITNSTIHTTSNIVD